MTTNQALLLPKSVRWENGSLFFLDQTQLPGNTVEEEQYNVEQVWDSIKKLKVRGAPAIGIAGAYGLVVAMRDQLELSKEEFFKELEKQVAYLDSSRPTAVNLNWALNRMLKLAQANSEKTNAEIFELLVIEAIKIHDEDRAICNSIGDHGKSLIKEGMGILTHCNAGALAVSELGTALAPIYKAHRDGIKFKVYADETRPLLQGARLTAWELQESGVDVTLICDNMAAHMMSQGLIDLIIVGTDRVSANGDVANKIGTLGLAILAKHFNIPMYIGCPSSTVDLNTKEGKDIKIEEREDEEVTHFGLRRTAPEGMKVRNPAFDVSPAELITGLITEKGVVYPPYKENLAKLFSE